MTFIKGRQRGLIIMFEGNWYDIYKRERKGVMLLKLAILLMYFSTSSGMCTSGHRQYYFRNIKMTTFISGL